MQKRWLALVVAWVTLVGSGAVLEADVSPRVGVRPSSAADPVAEGSSFTIEPPAAPFVREFDERERREQIRDWAVLGTIARLGVDPKQAASATYELPPARLPYLDELYSFEYGRGRRAYLGTRVLLFRDANDPDPVATIGRLADRVRMENGELPATVEIYVVRDQRDGGVIGVERAPDVSRDELFSPAYGYVEGDASTADALADWLSRADDLTYVTIAGDRAVLGGRRFLATRTPNLTVEDVSALYQAHVQLNGQRIAAQAKLRKLPPKAQIAVAHLVTLAKTGLLNTRAGHSDLEILASATSPDQFEAILLAARDSAAAAREPGISLDPEWLPLPDDAKHPRFLGALRAFAADPCGELRKMADEARTLLKQEPDDTRRTARARRATSMQHAGDVSGEVCGEIQRSISPKIRAIATKLDAADPSDWDGVLAAYHALRMELQAKPQSSSDWEAAATARDALRFREVSSKVQCARYDGVAGTQVAMTLFYTDLLAKLWESTDFGLAAPVIEVPGFLSAPHINLPAAFRAAVERNPGTRLWFGPRSDRVSRAEQSGAVRLAFEHRYSRIFAAGNNPARPGVEVEPNEDTRRTLGWWDRHFDDIADYEPQYHRQNQIMKWSLIAAAFADSTVAEYLKSTSVDRRSTFAAWQQANASELRFSAALPTADHTIPGRECIPLLASYMFDTMETEKFISGGVSTPGLDAPRSAPKIDPARSLGSRKPYVAETGGAVDRTATRAHPVVARSKVSFENAARAPTNTVRGPVKLGIPTIDYGLGKAPRELVIRAGKGKDAIGDLSISVERGVVRQRWTNGALEQGRSGEPRALKTIAEADTAARTGHAYAAAQVYEREIVKPTTPDDVARLALVDATRGRVLSLAARLQQLERDREQLTLGGRSALFAALDEAASPAVRQRVTAMVERGTPLADRREAVTALDGRLVVTRNIEASAVATSRPVAATDLSEDKIYIDGRVRAAHDGLHADIGASTSRWRKVRNVKMSELDASAFGAAPDRPADLPDVVRLPDGRTFEAPTPPPGSHARPGPRLAHGHIHLVEQCDGDHRTATTSDDCPESN